MSRRTITRADLRRLGYRLAKPTAIGTRFYLKRRLSPDRSRRVVIQLQAHNETMHWDGWKRGERCCGFNVSSRSVLRNPPRALSGRSEHYSNVGTLRELREWERFAFGS